MSESRTTQTQRLATAPAEAVNPLHQEYTSWQALFEAQPGPVQRFIEAQGRLLAETLARRDATAQMRFTLPEQVVVEVPASGTGPLVPVPPEFREQLAGGLIDRLTRASVAVAVHQRLGELEQSPSRAVAVSAGLLRHAAALHLVRGLLPAGRSVQYAATEGDEIPSLPVRTDARSEAGSAITASTDAIAEEGQPGSEGGRGELLVPYVPAARRFYLPQWVAFDEAGQLLVKSLGEAEAHVASMQRFVAILHTAISLAPYIVADEVYQQKRYGMLGQLVNQGRALARYQTNDIIQTMWRRAATQDLNRGLSLSWPYFDDQDLRLRTHSFEVIPAGRIMFVPALVVRAARAEQAKVAQDTRLSPSTRKHLLQELGMLETAFALPDGK
jgi:hypothetical protein